MLASRVLGKLFLSLGYDVKYPSTRMAQEAAAWLPAKYGDKVIHRLWNQVRYPSGIWQWKLYDGYILKDDGIAIVNTRN